MGRNFDDARGATQQPQPRHRDQPFGLFGQRPVTVGELLNHGRDIAIRGRRASRR